MPQLRIATSLVLLSLVGSAASCTALAPESAPEGAAPQVRAEPAAPAALPPPPRPRPEGWVAISPVDAPPGREDHTAVWTGTEMIVWGGEVRGGGVTALDSGARYNPGSDRWLAMTEVGVPERRDDHAVVWTGAEMIVWGGNQADEDVELLASGARYDPRADRWTATGPGPLSPRDDPTAVWTGTEMIIWGGRTFSHRHENTGARYRPDLDQWQATTTDRAPRAREDHSAVWTGTEMIIWGGWSGDDDRRTHLDDGARYSPDRNEWRTLSSKGAPAAREDHSAVWTGTEMIVWGGVIHEYAEFEFEPGEGEGEVADERMVEEAPAVEAAEDAPAIDAVETGRAGRAAWADEPSAAPRDQLVQLGTGARYDPSTDTWRSMSTTGAPSPREDHVAIWTGRELLIWGGRNGKTKLGDGAIYDPQTDRWRPIADVGPEPSPRWNHTAVWAEDQVIIWGGRADDYDTVGGRYTP